MRSVYLLFALALTLIAAPIGAAPPPQVKSVTWEQLRQDVTQLRLTNRGVNIFLAKGTTVRAVLKRIEEDALIVESNRKIDKQWRGSGGEGRIPRTEVTDLRFLGKQGRKGMIGGLAGLGAGAAIAAASAKSMEGQEGPAPGLVLLTIPIYGVVGYLIGHHLDAPMPEYRIVK